MSEAAKIAAEWWGNAVCGKARFDAANPVYDMLTRHQRATGPAVAQSGRDLFVSTLERMIDERISGCGECWLSVDYGPEGLLCDVARSIPDELRRGFSWPPKTHMVVAAKGVTVRNGYRAPTVRLLGEQYWTVAIWRREPYDHLSVYGGTDPLEANRMHEIATEVASAIDGAEVDIYCDGTKP